MLEFSAKRGCRDRQQARKESEYQESQNETDESASLNHTSRNEEIRQWDYDCNHQRRRPRQKQRAEFFCKSRIHFARDYFKVATKTSSSVNASEVKDSGASLRNCSMICAPSPLATSSSSRPLRRVWSAPLNSIAGAS